MFKIKGIKLVLICLLVTLSASCFSLLFVNAYSSFTKSEEPQALFSGGSGGRLDPYLISSSSDLNTLATKVNGGESYKGKYFSLTEDIDLRGNKFDGIGTQGRNVGGTKSQGYFEGNFNGNFHTIKNFYIEPDCNASLYDGASGSHIGCGFFSAVKGNVEIKNLKLGDYSIGVTYSYAFDFQIGGIVGYVFDGANLNINKCIVESFEIKSQSLNTYDYTTKMMGSIVGGGPGTANLTNIYASNFKITLIEKDITGTYDKVGALVGNVLNGSTSESVFNSTNSICAYNNMPDRNISYISGKPDYTVSSCYTTKNTTYSNLSSISGKGNESTVWYYSSDCNGGWPYLREFITFSKVTIFTDGVTPTLTWYPGSPINSPTKINSIGLGSATLTLTAAEKYTASATGKEFEKWVRTSTTGKNSKEETATAWIFTANFKGDEEEPEPDPDPTPEEGCWTLIFRANSTTDKYRTDSTYYINKTSNNTISISFNSSVCSFTFTENGKAATTTFRYVVDSGYEITKYLINSTGYTNSTKTITISGDTNIAVVTISEPDPPAGGIEVQLQVSNGGYYASIEVNNGEIWNNSGGGSRIIKVIADYWITDWENVDSYVENVLKLTHEIYQKNGYTYLTYEGTNSSGENLKINYRVSSDKTFEPDYFGYDPTYLFFISPNVVENTITLNFNNATNDVSDLTTNDAAESYSLKKDTIITTEISDTIITYSFKDFESNNILVTFNITNELYIFSSAGWENNAPITEDTTITPTVSQAYIYVRFNNATIGTHTAPPTGAVTKIDVGSLATPTGLNTNVLTFSPTLDGVTKTIKYTTIANAYKFTSAGITTAAELITVTPVLGSVLRQVTFANIDKATEEATDTYTVKNNTTISVNLNAAKNVLTFTFNAFNTTSNSDESKTVRYTSEELYTFSSAGWTNGAAVTADTTITPTVSQKYINVTFNNATTGTHTATLTGATAGTAIKVDINTLNSPAVGGHTLTFTATLDGVTKTVTYTTIANAYEFTASGITTVDVENISVTPELGSVLRQLTFADIDKATGEATDTYTVKNNTTISVNLNAAKNVLTFTFTAFNATTNADESETVTYTSDELYIFLSTGWTNGAAVTTDTTITPVLEQAYVLVTFGKTTGQAEISPDVTNQLKVRYYSGNYISDGVINWTNCTLSYEVILADGSFKTITYTINPKAKYTFDTSNRTPYEPANTEIVTINPTLILKMYDVGFGEA